MAGGSRWWSPRRGAGGADSVAVCGTLEPGARLEAGPPGRRQVTDHRSGSDHPAGSRAAVDQYRDLAAAATAGARPGLPCFRGARRQGTRASGEVTSSHVPPQVERTIPVHYGADYNPEQWPESVWPDDVERMREASVTMVSLGIFAWSRIQPAEGVFDFGWLDRVINLLHEGGIAVDLATATASPPPWMTAAYPEILAADENGATYWHGSRQHYAPSSPTYRRLAGELVKRLAERYVDHPAVVLWHVNNEYGCHLNLDYSNSARDAFRDWLRARYGTLKSLNEAWGTWFWAQHYESFDHIYPPRKAPYSHNPGQLLDFRRFTSDMLLQCYLMERDIIRAAGARQPITTNFMGAFKPANYWQWAQEMDVISDDCYPDPNDPESFRAGAFQRDLMRSLKPGTPWLLMEQSTNALNWRPSNAPKAPGQMQALSMQSVGRGADGILFFQWRQSRAGAEKFHSAMLPHAGTSTRTWREAQGLGLELAALPELPAGTRDARVAIVFDWENWWALENPDHPVVLDYVECVQGWYRAIHRQHVQVDLVLPTSGLEDYAVVVAPQLYLLTDDGAANLTGFVQGGGHLLVTAFSDIVDEHDRFREGGFLTQLGPLLGITLEDFGALVPPASSGPGQRTAPVALGQSTFDGLYLAEEIATVDAEVLATFSGGRTQGLPAFTTRVSGAGRAYYLATVPDDDGARLVSAHVFATAGIEPVLAGLPDTVEAAQRGEVTTLINHGADAVAIEVSGTNLLTGEAVDKVHLESFGYALLRRP
ncbi:beta-galactosidase [Arthrobacter sp. 260]|nr:beta-galactosidase [Arthrobacter sp. 260]NOJ59109.1 beta-galactosidase [Arthrobacter sp. 260]